MTFQDDMDNLQVVTPPQKFSHTEGQKADANALSYYLHFNVCCPVPGQEDHLLPVFL
jgi:hypothetical protein